MRNADLGGVDRRAAELSRVDMEGATLAGAVLAEADLNDATMLGACLAGADLRRADLRLARGLVPSQLEGATHAETTRLPASLLRVSSSCVPRPSRSV